MHSGVHPWMVIEVKATVMSMDTVTEGYAQRCPSVDGQWMVTANCDINGHCDRGVGTVVSIHK